jgi:acyl carrier protein
MELEKTITDYVLREFLPGRGPEALDASGGLIRGGVLDSMSILQLVGFLEDTYGIELQAHELDVENLDTVGDIARLVRTKLPESS